VTSHVEHDVTAGAGTAMTSGLLPMRGRRRPRRKFGSVLVQQMRSRRVQPPASRTCRRAFQWFVGERHAADAVLARRSNRRVHRRRRSARQRRRTRPTLDGRTPRRAPRAAESDHAGADHRHEAREQIQAVRRDAAQGRVCDQPRAERARSAETMVRSARAASRKAPDTRLACRQLYVVSGW